MSANEASFKKLVDVPAHYDRLAPPLNYGSKGRSQTFQCTNRLKSTLEDCLSELFNVWARAKPTIILTAGTIGDGENAHGQGLAFDLDGFYWGDEKFMMANYPQNRRFYLGINAHLFLFFSQVLSYHYPNHQDHFHVDFNFSQKFRPESNAQTFFVQASLKYLFDKNLGLTGIEHDGVDGIFGGATKNALDQVLATLGIGGSLTTTANWKKFLRTCRDKAFAT
jgi:hypothetical protein